MSTNTTRLKEEYEKIQQMIRQDSLITVTGLGAREAPRKFYVKYHCKGIVGLDNDGKPIASEEHELEVDLANFPDLEPQMRFSSPVWHPGVAEEEPRCVDLKSVVDSWDEIGSVALALVRVGQMLQYKHYRYWLDSPTSVKNKRASRWLSGHAIPTGIIKPDEPFDTRDLVKEEKRISGTLENIQPPSEETAQSAAQLQSDAGEHNADDRKTESEAAEVSSVPAISSEEIVDKGNDEREEAPVAASATSDAIDGGQSADAVVGVDDEEPKADDVMAKKVDPKYGKDDAADANENAKGMGSGKRKIVFGKLKSQEVHTEPFPLPRLLHWKPLGKQFDVKPPPFFIVVTQDVLATVNAHVSQDLKNELGGFLLGNRYVCPNSKVEYIRIDNCPDAKFISNGPVSINLVNETFAHLIDEKEGKYRGKDVLGWYHSHPSMGAFLSPNDVEVHKNRFVSPWTVALVIDPNRKTGGFFCWRDGELHPQAMVDFYELRGLKSTVTYVPWTNYECFDSNTDEPRRPQLAEGVTLGVEVIGESRYKWLPGWFIKYGAPLCVALLILAVWGWFAGWFTTPQTNRTNDNSTAAATNVAPINATPTGQPQATVSQPPPAGEISLTASRIFGCGQNYKGCKLAAEFKEKPKDLVIELEGAPANFNWEGNEAVIDISKTAAIAKLRQRATTSSTLIMYFSDANNPTVKTPYPYPLTKEALVPDLPRQEPTVRHDAGAAAKTARRIRDVEAQADRIERALKIAEARRRRERETSSEGARGRRRN